MASKVYKGCQRPPLFFGVPIKIQVCVYLPMVVVFIAIAYFIDSPFSVLLIVVIVPLHMVLLSIEQSKRGAWRNILLNFKWSVMRMDRYSKSIGSNYYGAYGDKRRQKNRQLS